MDSEKKSNGLVLEDFEIKILCDQIENNIKQTLDIAKFSITASCALIGFGLSFFTTSQSNIGFLIFLLPLVILYSAHQMILNRRYAIMQKASYLRAFAKGKYWWELFIQKLRTYETKTKYKKSSFYIPIMISIGLTGLLGCITSIVLSFPTPSEYITYEAYVAFYFTCAITIIWIVLFIRYFLKSKNIIMGEKSDIEIEAIWKTILEDNFDLVSSTKHSELKEEEQQTVEQ